MDRFCGCVIGSTASISTVPSALIGVHRRQKPLSSRSRGGGQRNGASRGAAARQVSRRRVAGHATVCAWRRPVARTGSVARRGDHAQSPRERKNPMQRQRCRCRRGAVSGQGAARGLEVMPAGFSCAAGDHAQSPRERKNPMQRHAVPMPARHSERAWCGPRRRGGAAGVSRVAGRSSASAT